MLYFSIKRQCYQTRAAVQVALNYFNLTLKVQQVLAMILVNRAESVDNLIDLVLTLLYAAALSCCQHFH
ncbi:hypothetical protein CMT41_04480 [Colwellia sp. MT41]|nr:hypothetical protein CMT41_04480 [Colwellia sp. MT41]